MFLLIEPVKLILLALLVTCHSAVSAQQKLTIEKAEIRFDFVSKDVQGSIGEFSAEIEYAPDQIEQSVFKGSVAVETINTGNFLRDWSLKKSKYFNEGTYPRILFESKEVNKISDGFEVQGNLTIKGITKKVTIHFKQGNTQLLGTFSLYSSDYDIDIKSKREDNLVNVEIDLSIQQ